MIMKIKYPDMRRNLISAVSYLANSRAKPVIEVRNSEGVLEQYFDFDVAINMIFDDVSIAENPQEWIGVVLRNLHEAKALQVLVERLELLLQDDIDTLDEKTLETESFGEMVMAAVAAEKALLAGD